MSRPKKNFNIELISTGNELLFGRLVDTNSAWIAKKVTENGGRVSRITSVGDEVKEIRNVIKESLSRKPDMIITTGGLGPSFDDRTIEAIASALGSKIVLDKRALKMLQRRLEETSRSRGVSVELSPHLSRLANLIKGSEPLENVVGLASGMKLRVDKTLIIALPGVPNEMKAIFKRYLLPIINQATGKRTVAKSIRVRVRRDVLTSIIQETMKTHPRVYFKTYAGDIKPGLGIKIDIMAEGETSTACEKILNVITKELKNLVEEKGGRLTIQT